MSGVGITFSLSTLEIVKCAPLMRTYSQLCSSSFFVRPFICIASGIGKIVRHVYLSTFLTFASSFF